MNFTFHTDDGHGWLFVSDEQLIGLGLNRQSFSAYSYQDGAGVYAEEDCDAAVVIKAALAAGHAFNFTTNNTSGDSFVRSLGRVAA